MLFIIPIISVLLATIGVHQIRVIKSLQMSIKSDIEAEFNFVGKAAMPQKRSIPVFSARAGAAGAFLTVQILAFVLGLLKLQHHTSLDLVLITVDILALLFSLFLASTVIKVQTN